MASGPDQSLARNEDQELIRGAALQFLEERQPLAQFREWREGDDPAGIPSDLWAEMSTLGWAGLLAPEEVGGAGLGFQELGVVFEALGRHVVPSPLLSSGVLATSVISIVRGWDAFPKAADLATGDLRVALALDETNRFAPDRIDTIATRDGDGYRLNGRKRPVLDGTSADLFLVVARIEDQADRVGVFAVPPGAERMTCIPLRWIDGRRAADLDFSQVQVGADSLLGEALPMNELIDPLVDRASAALAAELVGISAEAFAQTVEYLKIREQFDQKLAGFQALQHRCARMFVDVERTISLVRDVLRALDEGDAEASMLASAAKAMAGETARSVTAEALQLFGGLGMTDEQDIGLYFKRARASSVLFGDANYHYRRFARLNGF